MCSETVLMKRSIEDGRCNNGIFDNDRYDNMLIMDILV